MPVLQRENIHTFSDADKTVYTVINVPDHITIPALPNPKVTLPESLREMQTPRWFTPEFPEMAYLLRSSTATDILLSRLALDDKALRPIKYAQNEWGLAWEIRQMWKQLETLLCHVAFELLIFKSHDRERSGMVPVQYWPDPSERGYLDIHGTPQKAARAIRCARESFFFLAARCSMAIAIWVKTPATAHTWVAFLESKGMSSLWLDALQHSVVSKFAPGLRVGVFIDPLNCPALDHLPVFKRSHIPLFIWWRLKDTARKICARYPVMQQFLPVADDGVAAFLNPPYPHRRDVFVLFHKNQMFVHPPSVNVDALRPVGPYQQPGESRRKFIVRLEAQARAAQAKETDWQRERRQRRQAQASIDGPPPPWLRVYTWATARDLDVDIRPQWADLDIRVLVPACTVPGLWATYREDQRYYCWLYDTWDLGATGMEPDENMDAEGLREQVSAAGALHHLTVHSAIVSDLELICRQIATKSVIVTVSNTFVEDFFGVHPTMSTYHGVNYLQFYANVHRCFGMIRSEVEGDASAKTTYAGFAWAMIKNALYTDATRDCWDLDPRHESYLFEQEGLQERILRITRANITAASLHNLYFIQFTRDEYPPWLLAVEAVVVVYLLRRQSITTAAEAVMHLMDVGLPFHTVRLAANFEARGSLDLALPGYRLPTYRRAGFKPTPLDYQAFELRVMELLQRPHIRAAFTRGGIIWRVAMSVLGYDNGLLHEIQQSVLVGPSDNVAAHAALIQTKDKMYYIDDVLTEEEEDVFSGVFTLYTDQHGQTENVSWWPRQAQWRSSGMDNGIWSSFNESYFQRRLKDIKEGHASLLNIGEWKSALTQYRPAHVITSNLRRACEELLE